MPTEKKWFWHVHSPCDALHNFRVKIKPFQDEFNYHNISPVRRKFLSREKKISLPWEENFSPVRKKFLSREKKISLPWEKKQYHFSVRESLLMSRKYCRIFFFSTDISSLRDFLFVFVFFFSNAISLEGWHVGSYERWIAQNQPQKKDLTDFFLHLHFRWLCILIEFY
jgi:hypothetical protein